MAAVLVIVWKSVFAFDTGMFESPSLEKYALERSWNVDADIPPDGVKETTIDRFVRDERRVVLRWTSAGKVWGWSILNNCCDKSDSVGNYFIRDPKGKGVFTEKFPANEAVQIPAWIKD